MPSVTVLMPVYNTERYLRPAMESILAQSYEDFEFLIINDGSTDDSRKIIASYADKRIRLVDNESNLGQTATLNRGLCLAESELIARQDADDISHRRRLEHQVAFLRDHPDVTLLGTRGWEINEHGQRIRPVDVPCEDRSIRLDWIIDNRFIHPAVMFRKKVILDELGGYDETFSYCQDYDLWSRVPLTHRVGNLSCRLVNRRVHASSMTETMHKISAVERRRVIRRNIDAIFGAQAASDKEVDLIARFGLGFDEDSLDAFLDLLKRLLQYYLRFFPETVGSVDFRRTVAQRYAQLAKMAMRTNPSLVWRVLAESVPYYPVLTVSLSWLSARTFAICCEAACSVGEWLLPLNLNRK